MNSCALAGKLDKVLMVREHVCKFDVAATYRRECKPPVVGISKIPCTIYEPSKDVQELLRNAEGHTIKVEGTGRIETNTRPLQLSDRPRSAHVILEPRLTYFRRLIRCV